MKYKNLIIILISFCLGNVTPTSAEERIISAGGSITEIMYELGLAEHIIAVDSSSYYPFEATQKPKVGYFRRLSAEGVLSLNPTRLIGSNGVGPEETIAQIKNTGVDVKVFSQEIYTFEAWKAYIREVGSYFNLLSKAESIIARVEDSLLKANHRLSDLQKTAVFLMDLGDRGPVAAGNNTVPDMLFKLAGLNNIFKDYDGFKPFSTERLIQIKPDLIVMPNHVVEKLGGEENICQNMMIKLTTSERGCDILVMDALLALGFGTRIDQAVEKLRFGLEIKNKD